MTAHNAPKGILRKPMRMQLRKRKIIKLSPLHDSNRGLKKYATL